MMLTLKRSHLFLPLLLFMLLLAGCGDKPTEVVDHDGGFVLALPRVTVQIDPEGYPSVLGINADTLKHLPFGGVDLTGFKLDKEYVSWFTRANVQHMELVHRNDGLYVFVNGNAMPHMAWDGDSLSTATDIASEFNTIDPRYAPIIKALIPFIQHTGIDLVVKFPKADEAVSDIALRDSNAPIAMIQIEDQDTLALFRMHVSYDQQGVPSVLAVSANDIEKVANYSMRQTHLDPSLIQQMQEKKIQHITIRTTQAGLLLWVNDNALPYIAWSQENLVNGADLFTQMIKVYDSEEFNAVSDVMKDVLPALDNVDAEVVLRFPVPDGVTEIPIPQP